MRSGRAPPRASWPALSLGAALCLAAAPPLHAEAPAPAATAPATPAAASSATPVTLAAPVAAPAPSAAPAPLRTPASFAAIADRDARARALFLEATRVFFSPRCLNCHPDGDSPLQGDEQRLHDPAVARGPDDRGVPAMRCATCHQDHNLELARVPGAPAWHLAPRQMFWMGRTPGSLCAQLKDPARNGGRTLAKLIEHSAHDPLVGWGWHPGWSRTPAPGSQAAFGALVAAWVADGAACPREEKAP